MDKLNVDHFVAYWWAAWIGLKSNQIYCGWWMQEDVCFLMLSYPYLCNFFNIWTYYVRFFSIGWFHFSRITETSRHWIAVSCVVYLRSEKNQPFIHIYDRLFKPSWMRVKRVSFPKWVLHRHDTYFSLFCKCPDQLYITILIFICSGKFYKNCILLFKVCNIS